MRPVVVHGGGAAISRAMDAAGTRAPLHSRPPLYRRRHARHRRTRAGLRNQRSARRPRSKSSAAGRCRSIFARPTSCWASGCSSSDGDGQPIDLGHVGRVTRVDRTTIDNLCYRRHRAGHSLDVPQPTAAKSSTSTPTRPPRPWPRRWVPRSWCFSATSTACGCNKNDPDSLINSLTADAGPRADRQRRDREGHDSQGRGLPGNARQGRPQDPHHRRPRCGIRCCWKFTRTKGVGTEIVKGTDRTAMTSRTAIELSLAASAGLARSRVEP